MTISVLISPILIAIASIFNAVMDSVGDSVAFRRSRFSKLNPKWWSKEVSWQHVKFLPLTRYRPDAWHLAKSLMVIFMLAAAVLYKHIINWWADIIILGLVWNLVFNLFYHRILRKWQ